MKRQRYRIRDRIPNNRIQNLPAEARKQRTKHMRVQVKNPDDYSRRIVLLEDLQFYLLAQKLYSKMRPFDLKGNFEVSKGYETQFRDIAEEHGFNVSEYIEV